MNITIYQLFGINKTDTPVFDSVENQNYFFDHQGLSEHMDIDTGFYPPYFRNRIKVEITNLNLSASGFNYLRLLYNDKYYYYFITSIEYVNEDIILLNVEMDTIQTYMFDSHAAKYNYIKLGRETIVRWKDDNIINREYIRENISNGSFTVCKYNNRLNDDVNSVMNYMYVCKMVDLRAEDSSQAVDVSTRLNLEGISGSVLRGKSIYVPYAFAFIPYNEITEDRVSQNSYVTRALMKDLPTSPYIVDMYLIPFKVVDGLNVKFENNKYVLDRPSSIVSSNIWGINGAIPHGQGEINTIGNTVTMTTPYFKPISNETLRQVFDPYRCVALYDNNYVKLTIGDSAIRSEYPLYTLEELDLCYSYWADLSTGYRYYNIHPTETEFAVSKYNTIACNTHVLSLDLKNEPWTEYIANNKATMGGAIGGMFISLLTGGLISVGYESAGQDFRAGLSAIKTAGSASSGVYSEAIKQVNLQAAPSTIKGVGNAQSVCLSDDTIITIKMYLCDDFEECARYFEAYGYKVSKIIIYNPFMYLKNRHLFDYIKADDVGLGSERTDIAKDFADRLLSGIRMWHTTNGVLNIKLNGYFGGIGSVYSYDNIEEWKYQELTA